MMLALPAWSTGSWKKSSRLRSLHSEVALPPVWMQPLWMPLTATAGVNTGDAVLAAVTCASSTSHEADPATVLGSPVAEVPYQATSRTPGETTSMVGNVEGLLVVDSVTGALQVCPWLVL